MGLHDSIVGFDANGDGRVDCLDDLYMYNLGETGDGFLSPDDVTHEDESEYDDIDIENMSKKELREAIALGDIDPEDIDWDELDFDEEDLDKDSYEDDEDDFDSDSDYDSDSDWDE